MSQAKLTKRLRVEFEIKKNHNFESNFHSILRNQLKSRPK